MLTPLMAFTTPQTVRLTGIPPNTLQYWESTDVFRATYVSDRPRAAYRRFYTFRDIVSLRTLRALRSDYGIDLPQVREVGKYLEGHSESPWSSIRFGVSGKAIIFPDPVSGELAAGRPFGQGVMPFDIASVALSTEQEARKLTHRDPGHIGKVSRHRNVMSNAWVIAGTRIPTSAIWSFHEDGASLERTLRAYPDLTAADVESAIKHEATSRGLVAYTAA